jgi:hypothetical protein
MVVLCAISTLVAVFMRETKSVDLRTASSARTHAATDAPTTVTPSVATNTTTDWRTCRGRP